MKKLREKSYDEASSDEENSSDEEVNTKIATNWIIFLTIDSVL